MIEVATLEDLPEIIKMGLKIPEEHGFTHLPTVDITKVNEYFYDKFNESPIFIYKVNDKIIGFVGTEIDEFWWSKEKVVTDFIFYVDPDNRNIEVFNALLGALRDFAKINKLPVVTRFMSNNRTKAKEELFKRQGFKKSGFIATHGV